MWYLDSSCSLSNLISVRGKGEKNSNNNTFLLPSTDFITSRQDLIYGTSSWGFSAWVLFRFMHVNPAASVLAASKLHFSVLKSLRTSAENP